ncbi:hypothetical protein OG762_01140 [Streptomyces sp. NBC_01136]|nr:hypothetical protein OG762_01140 [Streptomyces sp. NBC_01136]
MTHRVVTAHPGSSFEQVAWFLRNKDVSVVPVADDDSCSGPLWGAAV